MKNSKQATEDEDFRGILGKSRQKVDQSENDSLTGENEEQVKSFLKAV